jgi:carbon monoxide dehydrogenase subunit G
VIEVDERFEVAATPDAVWRVLSDPRAVVGCVPGASLVGENPDGTYDGALTVKFGPLAVAFLANVALELDAAARTGRLVARGKDRQGGARFTGTSTFTVNETPAHGSGVAIQGGVEISGRLASMIESGATIVVKRLAGEFAERLAARCAGDAHGLPAHP